MKEGTAISWNTPVTWTVGQIVGASDMNSQVRDNMNYLFASRPIAAVNYTNGANYSTTSTTPADVDATHLIMTFTISGTRVFVISEATLTYFNASSQVGFLYNYSVGLNALGAAGVVGNGAAGDSLVVSDIFSGLTPGSQTFKLRYATSNPAGTVTVVCLDGVNPWHNIRMTAWEI